MPIDSTALLKGLKPVLKALDADLLARAKDPGVEAGLKAAWEHEKAAGRTAADFKLWRRRRTIQVSIAWVLSVVFVRTLEDRGFLARRRIAGPGAEASEQQFTELAPFLTPRDYLLMVFGELAKLPGAADLFDARHNPVWVLAPSADAARQLLDFFRHPGKKGETPPIFDGEDTRFLGDLYQKLSEDVRKRFALLQTPEFVEEFILDQTLDPAVRAFGLEDVRLIDPTCGSGHFLLGAFHRLFDAWQGQAPGEDRQVLAQRALGQVYGCDLNPYAVAVARFRLTLEFLQATGIEKLERAPRLPLNLCVADSLLHGVEGEQMRLSSTVDDETWKDWGDRLFALEDEAEALRILSQRYHAVVGNPPYIKEPDTVKRRHLINLYDSAFAQFTLSAPFTERFFGLAVPAGFAGLINANAFTKRDFGKILIEQVLPRLDIGKVIDTSGAYIPGHGTPTLLLFGRNQPPGPGAVVAVLGKRGEAVEPAVPATAPVWTEIVDHHDTVGFDGRFVSVEAIPREEMAEHPWVLAGGGARGLKAKLEATAENCLASVMDDIGFSVIVGQDDAFIRPRDLRAVDHLPRIPLVVGEEIRDWTLCPTLDCLRPFSWPEMEVNAPPGLQQHLWPWRRLLESRIVSGTTTMKQAGKAWFDVRRLSRSKHKNPVSIGFAFVTTHNHFILDRGGKIFNRSAPVIKLKEQYDEDYHLALLGLLNSSVACFWMKMVCFDKGSSSGGTIRRESWEPFFEFDGTKLKMFPVVWASGIREYAARLDKIAAERQEDSAEKVLSINTWTDAATLSAALSARHSRDIERLEQMVGLQEELDWFCYRIYGLATETNVIPAEDAPRLRPGHRPFEIEMASSGEPTDWFSRHGWQQTNTIPSTYPESYRSLVNERMRVTNNNKALQLVEKPNFKRRWYHPDFDEQDRTTLRSYLLDRVESLLEDQPQPTIVSARQLAAGLQGDSKAQAVAEVYTSESTPDLEHLVTDLVKAEGVPYVAALRYTDTGLEKHDAWRETWALQRREDAGEKVGEIAVPPKYGTGDYRRTTYWSHRGQLDVPKERFVLYPNAETDNDDTPWLGWAGWDHLQKATALSGVYQQRKTEEGWEKDKLLPLLAGLHELVPWLIQWHNQPSEAYGGQRLGDFFRDFVNGETHALGCSTADLEAWRPVETTRGRKSNKKTASEPKLTTAALLAAFDSSGAELAQADLAKSLGVSSAVVGKVAKACIADGALIQTSGRPKRFALARSEESET